jgi:two-component system, chemotaxis family, sensor kinase CheA
MNALLEQFLSESRDALQGIGGMLMRLEKAPEDADAMRELFRLVHTLKGNSGLFDFPEMTRVLHASEDLMSVVRNGNIRYSSGLADHLMDAMDFVGLLCDEVESGKQPAASTAESSARLAASLRALIPPGERRGEPEPGEPSPASAIEGAASALASIPEEARAEAERLIRSGSPLCLVRYSPSADCFFQGADPLLTVLRSPGRIWGRILPRRAWPPLAELDAYRCELDFQILESATREAVAEHFRYALDQATIVELSPRDPGPSQGDRKDGSAASRRAWTEGELAVLDTILAAQRRILLLDDGPPWRLGRLLSVAAVLANCGEACGDFTARREIEGALDKAVDTGGNAALLDWLDAWKGAKAAPPEPAEPAASAEPAADRVRPEEAAKFGRRVDDGVAAAKSLKVDQAKIDRLMNLIGEMVVSKNALPYLARRAELQFGARELSREIKIQYGVINRIVEEMQDAIMQVRMMPVSFVFQRFPRMVRDISRKLGKEVQLDLVGEETEIDKNLIEALADPLVHIVRNSLDHGIESPELRRASGKSPVGKLTLRAAQDADRIVIEVSDDGKGIDPEVMKRKAYEKGFIDEQAMERMTDRDAVNLVFLAGLSTSDVVSDLSGRGVGMDVVRSAVERCHGDIDIQSRAGKGTSIRISLPLSMAVTQVMVIESDGQLFGVPMDSVVETVRVPRRRISTIKRSMTTTLRDRVIPLKALNALLGLPAEPLPNEDGEMAVLVARAGSEMVGIIVDDFRETLGLIQKPMQGALAGLAAYSGSAILGDGSVLMVLNVKGVF